MLPLTGNPGPLARSAQIDDRLDVLIPEQLTPRARTAYRWHLRAWWQWRGSTNRSPWPARSQDVAKFIESRMADRESWSTSEAMLVAIRGAHRHTGRANPTHDPEVREAIRAARQAYQTRSL